MCRSLSSSQPDDEPADPQRTRQRQANGHDQQQDEEGNAPGQGQELDRRLKTALPTPRRDGPADIYDVLRNCRHARAPGRSRSVATRKWPGFSLQTQPRAPSPDIAGPACRNGSRPNCMVPAHSACVQGLLSPRAGAIYGPLMRTRAGSAARCSRTRQS